MTFIKGGEFLIKDLEAKDIFIPEEFTEEQLMMANATSEFVEKELHPNKALIMRKVCLGVTNLVLIFYYIFFYS